ncbi:MAG: hypothetical protein OEY05_06775 [Paracoccaceae bacterium]|nr:hypothetical protein [Paracoccaceae bacterium]MDH5529724.1 hypothetical protein [Paracoccaceae bacterium]
MSVQDLTSRYLQSDSIDEPIAALSAKAFPDKRVVIETTEFPTHTCREALNKALRAISNPSEIAIKGQQFTLCLKVGNGSIVSFRVSQNPGSTVWMHFLKARVVFDTTDAICIEDVAKAEINAVINTFSILPGNCRISIRPLANLKSNLVGLGIGFLDHADCDSNLQDVHPFTANSVTRVDYTAFRALRQNMHGQNGTVISLSDRVAASRQKPCPADATPKAAPAADNIFTETSCAADADKANTLLLVSPAKQGRATTRPTVPAQEGKAAQNPNSVYHHKQRLHLW